jgi:hypothetical protein
MLDRITHEGNQSANRTLDDLASAVRRCCEEIRNASLTALGHALDAGDYLIEAQSRVSINWKEWLRANCFLAVSTAQLYQQLARHRAEIEAEITRFPDLSLCAARRLIAKPPKPKPAKPLVPEWLTAWNKATAAEKTAGLATIKVAAFLAVIPPDWRAELMQRVRGLESEIIPNIDDAEPTLTNILRLALSHLAAASNPKAAAPEVHVREQAALNALRGILRRHPEIHDLAVGPACPRRRRAA